MNFFKSAVAKYCYKNKMSKDEYIKLYNYILNECTKYYDILKSKHTNFLQYEKFELYTSEDTRYLYIQCLKALGVEFIEDCKYYRI